MNAGEATTDMTSTSPSSDHDRRSITVRPSACTDDSEQLDPLASLCGAATITS